MLAVFAAVAVSVSVPAQVPACSPLQRAALDGDVASAQRLAGRRMLGMGPPKLELEERSDTDGKCFRRTPLMLAAEHGARDVAKILISSGASIEAVALLPELGDEALDARCLAIAHGHDALVALLEEAGAKPRACTDNALLFAALAAGRADLVERQLRAHPSDATLTAALMSAVGKRRGKAVDLVVAEAMDGAKPDLRAVFTAATDAGDAELIRQLAAGGARVQGGDELAQAFTSNQATLVEPLIAAGARADTQVVRDAIIASLRDKKSAVLLALVDTGYRGDPALPLLTEAIPRVPGIVPKLVKAGVGVEVDDENGKTPLMAAAIEGDHALVELLLERGASARTGNVECLTANDLKHRTRPLPEKLAPKDPVVPGRAARQLGVTCGEATFSLTFPETFEVMLPGGQRSIRSGVNYRLTPGGHILRVRSAAGPERKMAMTLRPGLNRFSESLDPARPLPVLEAPPDPATLPLELPDVLAVASQHRPDVVKCRKTGNEPRVVVSFVVTKDGTATDVQAGTGAFGKCVKDSILTWKFPPNRAAAEPFLLPFQ